LPPRNRLACSRWKELDHRRCGKFAKLARNAEHSPQVAQLAVNCGDRGFLPDPSIDVVVDLAQVNVGRAGKFEGGGERLNLMDDIFP
jgi:hypothetical protein